MSAENPRPAEICAQLLQAMGASEGRRKRRKRDTTPDALGMAVKRELLAAVIAADPAPDEFEAWLFQQIHRQSTSGVAGATRAMAMQIHDEWQFAVASAGFRDWLAAGAPSDDTG
jgi:hypothetical protein